MKLFALLLLLTLAIVGVNDRALAQSQPVKDAAGVARNGEANKPAAEKPSLNPNDARTAAQLFEDADKYLEKKFAEFEKRHMPFDARLSDKIKQEQRDLAASYATLLAARKLEGQDVYYLGLLYNLARNFDAALETMRRFLAENPKATGEPAQNARAIIVIQAAKKGLLEEASNRLAEYAKDQPQLAEDRYALENWVGVGYFKTKDYEHALPHAQEMWSAAKEAAKKKRLFERDTILNDAVVLLSETELKLKKKDDAIAAVQEMNALSLSLPSGNLRKWKAPYAARKPCAGCSRSILTSISSNRSATRMQRWPLRLRLWRTSGSISRRRKFRICADAWCCLISGQPGAARAASLFRVCKNGTRTIRTRGSSSLA